MRFAEARILPWLRALDIEKPKLVARRGDVSPRRYFRAVGHKGSPVGIVAMYPLETALESERFLATTELFEAAGVRVPRVLAAEPKLGLLLLEDLGDVSLFDLGQSDWTSIGRWYQKARSITSTLAAVRSDEVSAVNLPLDARRLEAELADAKKTYLSDPLFSGSASERRALEVALDHLCRSLERELLVVSHRDFMSRNLMVTSNEPELVVIDHQDTCLAPRFYDLASLLNDSFYPAKERELQLLGPVSENPNELAAYRRCAVQRTLKACATFVRFARQGYGRYLRLLAPTVARAADHLEQLPEGARLPTSVFLRWRDSAAINAGLERLAEPSGREC